MAILLMRSEATGAEWRVWPDPEPAAPGAVQETGRYLFELKGDTQAAAADLLIDDVALEALRSPAPDTARWRWSPGFHAGVIEAELRLPGQTPRRFEIVTDPDRRKLTRNDFDTMVREILDDTFALFSLSSFRKGIAKGAGARPPAIARLEFLRTRVDELEEIVAVILRHPRHMLTAEETALPYHRATSATGPEILRSFRSGRVGKEQGSPSRLPAQLKGFLPECSRTMTPDIVAGRDPPTADTAGRLIVSGIRPPRGRRRAEAVPSRACSKAGGENGIDSDGFGRVILAGPR